MARRGVNYDGVQFDAVIAYVNEHYADEAMSVTLLRDRFGISTYILGCCFKEITGQCFWDYVIDLRMARAKELLASESCEIREVAEQVGYVYASYFAKIFRSRFGISPSEYRRDVLAGNME